MKRLMFLPVLLAALAVYLALPAGCAHVTPVVSGIVHCAEQGVHDAALHVLDDVASALATGNYLSALADLVTRFGEGAVDCAAAELATTSHRNAAISGDQLEAAKAERAKAWLASRPVTLD